MDVTLKDGDVLDDLLTRFPKATTFYLEAGNYTINKVLHINKSNISLLGLEDASKIHVFQKNINMDGIAVRYSDNVIIKNISFHVEHNNKVCLTVASCNDTKIEDCYFYGNSNTFTVFYAGPSGLKQGQDTLDAYNKDILDNRNVFRRNVIYTKWSGDNVAFCLQNRGLFTYNIIRGGKAAIYMCKNSWVTMNRIFDCVGNGIFVSLPTFNVQVKYNTLYECADSAIVVRNQVEHGTFPRTPSRLLIRRNYIYDAKDHSIELNDADDVLIDYNTALSTDIYGLYCLRCNNIRVIKNKLSDFKIATIFEQTNNCIVKDNVMMSMYPNYGNSSLKLENSSNNTFTDNNVYGKILFAPTVISSNSLNNKIENNVFHPYYNYELERNMLKH